MLKMLSQRERKLGLMISALVLVFLLDMLIYLPVKTYFSALDEKIIENENRLSLGRKLIANESGLVAHFREYRNILTVPGKPEEDMAVMLNEAEALSKRDNIEIIDIKPDIGRKDKNGERINLGLGIKGKNAEIAQYIYHLLNSKQLFVIENLDLKRKDDSKDLLEAYIKVSKLTSLPVGKDKKRKTAQSPDEEQ